MKRTKKSGAETVQENALYGHNHDEIIKITMEKFHREELIIQNAKERQKAILREGKEAGVLKTAIRKAYKDLMQTAEQKQAHDEIEAARKEYVKTCKEVGLFVPEEEAA